MRRSNLTLILDLSYSSPSPSPSPSIVPRKSPPEVVAQVVEVHEDNKKATSTSSGNRHKV